MNGKQKRELWAKKKKDAIKLRKDQKDKEAKKK